MAKKTKKAAAPKAKVKAKAKAKAPAKRTKRKVTVWTPADEAKLRKLAGTMPTAKLAKMFGRSVAAITFKAFAMRLSLRLANSNRGRRLKKGRR
jgi:hypothetical protein